MASSSVDAIDNNVKFSKQSSIVEEWLELWTNECRKLFLERLIARCSGGQLEFLFSVTEPLHHRGFIYSAQHVLRSCPPISTPSSRQEALLFALENVADKFYRPQSAVLRSKEDVDKIINTNSSLYNVLSGGLFKTVSSKKPQVSKKRVGEIKRVLNWYENYWTDSEKLDILYLVLCKLSVHELYHATLLLNLRRYRDFVVKLPSDLSLQILSYLTPKDIVNASEVSKEWHELCTSDLTWSIKCAQHSVPLSNPENVKQQELFMNNILLKSNWKNGRCRVNTFYGSTQKFVSVAYDPKSGKIATGMTNGEIRIWSLCKSGGALLATLLSHTKSVWVVEWYKANCLISCSSDGSIKIWNIKKGICQKSIDAHVGKIWTIKCDGDVIYSGSDDKTIKCWDVKRCELLQTYTGHNGSVFALDMNGSDQLLSGSADKTLRIWDAGTGECLRSIWVSHTSPGWVMSLSVSEGHVACCFNDKVAVYHIRTGILVSSIQAHSAGVESVQLVMDEENGGKGGTLVTSSKDCTVKYWDLASKSSHRLEGHTGTVHDVIMTSERIISVSSDCTLRVWSFNCANDTHMRRKTVVSGGLGQLFMCEEHYDEQLPYESEQTRLYKKHLAKNLARKDRKSTCRGEDSADSTDGSRTGSLRQMSSSLSDVMSTAITPVEIPATC